MRLTLSLATIALAAATPVMAQNETVDPATNSQVDAVNSNAVAVPPADPAAGPAVATAPLPPDEDLVAAETDIAVEDDDDDHDRGFPWGLIGLVGLVGLLGRRRSS